MFVFGNYQRTNADIALLGQQFLTVNNAHRNGNFSDWRQSGDNEPINPATGLPFPGDQISPSQFSPVAVGLLPGLPGTDNANGLFFGGGGRDIYHENQFMTRGDWTINDSQRMFVRYFYTHQPRPFRFSDGNLLNQNSSWDSKYWNIAGNHTWMISPTLVNTFTFSWNKTDTYAIHPLTLPDGTQVNMCILGSNMTCNDSYPPMINDFYFGWDIGGDLNENFRRNYTITENVNWIKGKHLIVAGVDVLGEHSQLGTDWGSNPFVWGGNYYAAMNSDANFLLGLRLSVCPGIRAILSDRQPGN